MKHERKHTREKIHENDILHAVEEAVKNNYTILLVNDVDRTTSNAGVHGEDDPRDSHIYPESGTALSTIEEAGHFVDFLSGRAAEEVEHLVHQAGIKHAISVGSGGYEVRRGGNSVIAGRFLPFEEEMREILTDMKRTVYSIAGQTYIEDEAPNVEISTPGGPLILQQKGIWLAHVYNMNLLNPEYRGRLVPSMRHRYESSVSRLLRQQPELTTKLLDQWGIKADRKRLPWEVGRYSQSFEPLNERAKQAGLFDIYRVRNAESQKAGKPIGLILYAGDDRVDAAPMEAARRIAQYQNSVGRKVDPTLPLLQTFGIWARPHEDKEFVKDEADYVVQGQEGYAKLLTKVAAIVKKHG